MITVNRLADTPEDEMLTELKSREVANFVAAGMSEPDAANLVSIDPEDIVRTATPFDYLPTPDDIRLACQDLPSRKALPTGPPEPREPRRFSMVVRRSE